MRLGPPPPCNKAQTQVKAATPSRQELSLPHGQAHLAARLHLPAQPPACAVVVAHGLQSSMASEKLNRLCQALAGAGHAALIYDAAGCGASPGQHRQTTLTRRGQEYLGAADFLADRFPGLPLVFAGSSLGGSAAILAASQRTPLALLLWSTPVDLSALKNRLEKSPDPPDLPEMAADLARHDLPALLGRLAGALFVHGQQDEVVPVSQAHQGHQAARPPKDLLILPGADHRLSQIAHQDLALERSLAWIGRQLRERGC